ncbi:MAG: UDP-N-acetylglucosamine--N-acetylmuramyl-(pentapeptide) pyrophosphoryl-undecaprenol N-acetylglucosamine transferase [Candidatus Binatus sp.]
MSNVSVQDQRGALTARQSGAVSFAENSPHRYGVSHASNGADRNHASSGVARPRRIAITVGGTAGHTYPGLALAENYAAASDRAQILIFGRECSLESQAASRSGYRFAPIAASPMLRERISGKARALANLGSGFVRARAILRAERIELAIGFGGYACAGTLLAARSLGLRTVVHESNPVPGLTNRVLGRLVHRICVTFEEAGKWFPPERTVVTGTPIRGEIIKLALEVRIAPGGGRPARILVTGGSLGSAFLNERVPRLLELLQQSVPALEVLHQTGYRAGLDGPEGVVAQYAACGVKARTARYIEDMAEAYRWADFAISCAGANTLAELAVLRLPALIVPMASVAHNHQLYTARAFSARTGTRWVTEEAWEPEKLAAHITSVLRDREVWMAASNRMRNFAAPGAAVAVIACCEGLLNGA